MKDRRAYPTKGAFRDLLRRRVVLRWLGLMNHGQTLSSVLRDPA